MASPIPSPPGSPVFGDFDPDYPMDFPISPACSATNFPLPMEAVWEDGVSFGSFPAYPEDDDYDTFDEKGHYRGFASSLRAYKRTLEIEDEIEEFIEQHELYEQEEVPEVVEPPVEIEVKMLIWRVFRRAFWSDRWKWITPKRKKIREKKRKSSAARKKTNKRKTSEKSAMRMFGLGVAGSRFEKQSNSVHAAARALRDQQQRDKRKEKAKLAYKSKSKEERLEAVSKAKNKKQTEKVPIFEQQGARGWITGAFAGLGSVFLAMKAKKGICDAFSKKLTDALKNARESLKNLFGKFVWQVPLVLVVWWLFHQVGHFPWAGGLVLSALSVVICPLVFKRVAEFFRPSDAVYEKQAAGVGGISKLLCTLLALTAFKKKMRPTDVGEFMKRASLFTRASEGVEGIIDWMLENFKLLVNWISSTFTGGRVTLFKQLEDPLRKWMKRVDEVMKANKTYVEVNGVDEADVLLELVQKGFEFKSVYAGTKVAIEIVRYLSDLNGALKPYAGAINARNNCRMEPVMATIVGSPGTGKTHVAMAVVSTVLKLSGALPPNATKEDVARNMWQKGSSPYWNGYAQQKALVMDDAFQTKTALLQEENDFMNVIKAVSSWSFPLNMADLDSKGRIYFLSEFIYATTNVGSIYTEAIKAIHDPGAVTRRFSFPYKLHVKPEFLLKGMLNWKAFHDEEARVKLECTGIDRFPWGIWDVQKHDFLKDQPDGPMRPLRDVVVEMAEELKKRREGHAVSMTSLDSYIAGLMPPDEKEDPDVVLVEKEEVVVAPIEKQAKGVPTVIILEPEGTVPADRPVEDEDYARAEAYDAAKIKVLNSWQRTKKYIDEETGRVSMLCLFGLVLAPFVTFWMIDMIRASLRLFVKVLKRIFNMEDHEDDLRYHKGKLCTEWNKHFFAALYNLLKKANVNLCDYNFRIYTSFSHKVIAVDFWTDTYEWALEREFWDALEPAYYFTDEELLVRGFPEQQSNHKNKINKYMVQSASAIDSIDKDKHRLEQERADSNIDYVYANLYAFTLEVKGRSHCMGHVLFIEDTMAAMPKHYSETILEDMDAGLITGDTPIVLINMMQTEMRVSFTVKEFLVMPSHFRRDNDLQFTNFKGANIRSHKTISSYFVAEDKVSSYQGRPVRLDVPRIRYVSGQIVGASRTTWIDSSVKYVSGIRDMGFFLDRGWSVNVTTRKGDCGSPLCVQNPRDVGGKVCMGIHVAGKDGTKGFSVLITSEMVTEATDTLRIVRDCFAADLQKQGFSLAASDLPFEKQGSFLPIGQIEKAYNLPRKSKYYKVEEIYDMFGPYNFFPAKLSPFPLDGEIIYPMFNAVEPYSAPMLNFNQEYLPTAIHVAMDQLTKKTKNCTRELMTIEKAVLGEPMMKFRSLPRSTSPGFPDALECKHGKKHIFGTAEEYDLGREEFKKLRIRVEYILDEARQGRRLSHVFIDFLKDELRKEEKVRFGKTRLISCSPVDYTIAVRMMFGSFTAAFMRNHTTSGMAPGICAYTDWGTLANFLSEKGPNVFDGDFKGFDASEQACLLTQLCDFINAWYDDGPDNARIRSVLFLELMHSRHLGGDGFEQSYIYQWNVALPSGHPLTTIINSMYSLVVIVASYIKLTGDRINFWHNVRAVTYGDDNVVNPSVGVMEKFNQCTLAQALVDYGMVYTPGRKDGVWTPVTTLDNVVFLQRMFRNEGNRWLAPLALDSFLYTPYWGGNRQLQKQITIDNFERSLEELSMHDPSVWEEYAPQIIEYLLENVGNTRAPATRKEYQRLILSRGDHWY